MYATLRKYPPPQVPGRDTSRSKRGLREEEQRVAGPFEITEALVDRRLERLGDVMGADAVAGSRRA